MTPSSRFFKKQRVFFLLALLFLSPSRLHCSQEDALQQKSELTMEQLGSQIHTSLAVLKARSQSLTEELQGQKIIVEEYKTKLSALTISLDNTNKRLYDYETKLIAYEQKLKTQKKLLRIGFFLVVAFILVRIATLILRIKGVKLPEIVNILL